MNSCIKYIAERYSRLPVLMLITVWAIAGCSESGNPVSADNQTSSIDSVVSNGSDTSGSNQAPNVTDTDTDSASVTEVVGEDSSSDLVSSDTQSPVDLTTPTNSNGELNSDLELPDNSNSSVADPLVQNTVFVSFDITVPAYQSNELSLEVAWGGIVLSAGWVGDEFWTVSGELPTEVEDLLIVTFFDSNGAIELARYTQPFRTGLNASEAIQVTADQFDSENFDADEDGVSNLDELLAGDDPTVVEDSRLEIRDFFTVFRWVSVKTTFESQLTEERPISTTTTEPFARDGSIDTDTQIDIDGNGMRTDSKTYSCNSDRFSGVRSVAGNAITWVAYRSENDCDFSLVADVTNTVSVVDETTRTFVEESEARRTGSFTNSWQRSTNLTGRLIDDTSLCEPIAGTISSTFVSRDDGHSTFTAVVSKEEDDQYWRVETETVSRNFFVDPVEVTVTGSSEYFARELNFNRSREEANPGMFICDFVDF